MEALVWGLLLATALSAGVPAADPVQAASPPTTAIVFRDVFHVAGIPGVSRNAKGTVDVQAPGVAFVRAGKPRIQLPFERIRRVKVLSGARHYENATVGAAMAFGYPGAFLILKKRHVDLVLLEYRTPAGGRGDIVLQFREGDGESFSRRLADAGVEVGSPETDAVTPAPPPDGDEGRTP